MKRKANFELMRVVAMLMIVIWHIIVHGRLNELPGVYGVFFNVILLIVIVHVNSYIILTGYFQYKSTFKPKKLLSILGTSWFYRILFTVIFIFIFHISLGNVYLFQMLSPLDFFENYYFITNYAIIYLFSPFFNSLIQKINQKEHRRLLIILFICFSVLPAVSNDSIIKNNGHDLIQFIFMYFLGAYLGKYDINNNLHLKNYSQNKIKVICLITFITCAFLNLTISNYGNYMQSLDSNIFIFIGNIISSKSLIYSNPIVIIQSVSFFVFFKNLNIKDSLFSKFIVKISPYCLGVYLITENYLVKEHIYSFLKTDINSFTYNNKFIIYLIIVTLGIFIVCTLIECIRQKIFEFIGKRKPIIKIKEKFSKFIREY